ncbi:MAG TPA: hypothetical protein VHX44_03275 [Planctomycetota bacterium]|nr:hypothetical protein [Planctomycetota bacterium]
MNTAATSQSAELTCEEAEALLPLVADGALDADADPALFAHLARCCDCQDALMRHDVVTVALEATRTEVPVTVVRRAPIRHVFLPWPAALAASLAAAAGLWMWLATLQAAHTTAQAPTTQVVQVLGTDGQPVYVVVQGDQVTVIDPRAIDGKGTGAQPQVLPAKFITPQRP